MIKPITIRLIVADFYQDIARNLVAGARNEIDRYKRGKNIPFIVNDTEEIRVPGALEIPAAIRYCIEEEKRKKAIYGFVALGCVIRGETSHYDIVANESARGLQILAIDHLAVIGNGILTVENMEQAKIRANPGLVSDHGKGAVGNKGGFAAQACLHLLELKYQAGLL